jgi:uncharacterized protein YggE
MSSIRVTGTSTVIANPDRARVDVGVVTQAQQSQIAVSQNARTFDAVMSSLRKTFGTPWRSVPDNGGTPP